MHEHILFLSPFFHPEPISTGKYNTFLVNALVKKGITVDVVCFYPLYPGWRPQLCRQELSGVGIYRGGKWIRYPKKGLLRRAVLEGAFLVHVLRHAARIKRYSQVVAVLPPMLFLPLVWVAAGPQTRVTAIVHDLQGIMAGVGIRRGQRVLVRIVRFLEALVLGRCHRLIVLSNGMASFLSESYKLPFAEVAVCWPFVTLDVRGSGNRLGHLFADDKKHIVYAGALGEKQNPACLVSFFHHLVHRRSDAVCHIFSGGPVFEILRKDRRWQNPRLVFHDFVAEQDLNELYLRSHIQVISEKPGFSKGAIPSKLPNLLAAGVLILYIGTKNSDVWRIVQTSEAGLCADGWDFEMLDGLVDRLLQQSIVSSHDERRSAFERTFGAVFSVESLIGELLE